ncbi:MAG: DUF2520 domain-containing protein [Prevotellaceae bacterium]|jgi:predicted short-subunit dehydrogenase-like oxidoreductase (DUF2520 family)|nr:DUF2520 domain-containing protein [Prevotellaceae bacterium]
MRITIIGSGNVATHLAVSLHKECVEIVQIYSRNMQNAIELANKVGAEPVDNLNKLSGKANVCIFAVTDDIIKELLSKNANVFSSDTLLLHTAGSVSIDVFDNYAAQFGAFYPLQTFSKKRELDFSEIPVFIEGNTQDAENRICHLAQKITKKIYAVNFEQRKQLHLAGVFACNFTNFMYYIANELIKEKSLNFKMLVPLIFETAHKTETLPPAEAQTGPAIRNDSATITQHIKLLENHKDWQQLYKFISEEIKKL